MDGMMLVNPRSRTYENKLERMVIGFLLVAMICFSFFFPIGYTDHEKLVHFAAHVGMSFVIVSCFYVVGIVKFRMSKYHLFFWLFLLTIIVGSFYKFLEIAGEGIMHVYRFGKLLIVTGYYTSMSENIVGSLGVALLINYVDLYRNELLLGMRRAKV